MGTIEELIFMVNFLEMGKPRFKMIKTVMVSVNSSWNIYNFRASLIQSMMDSQYKVIGVAPYDEYAEKLKNMGCEFLPLEIQGKGKKIWVELKLCWDIYQLLKKIKPNLVLAYTIKPNLYFSWACYILDIPIINTITGLGRVYLKSNVLSKAISICYRLAFKKSKQVFFQNQDDLMFFLNEKMVSENIAQLVPGSGVDVNYFSPQPYYRLASHVFKFLFVGRVLVEKGIQELVAAARLLSAKGYRFELVILGHRERGVLEPEFGQWIEDAWIDYLGVVDDVRPYISQADCIVLPSYREGLSKALLEAAAMAKPIITSDVPGCREIVIDGMNGYLCQKKNILDLNLQMEKILNLSYDDLDKMGELGRQKISEEYCEELVIEKYLAVVKRVFLEA